MGKLCPTILHSNPNDIVMITDPKELKYIVIAGPTASGKSSLAIKLAKEINGVIINADSRQIYKEMSIGTARPSSQEMQGVPHYLYGHISVKENYNIYKYQQDVKKVLKRIPNEKTPILVGGSGLYIDSVIFNYKLENNGKKSNTQSQLREREKLNQLSLKELQNLIKEIDPKLLSQLNESDQQNPVRLVRVIESGGKKTRGQAFEHTYFVVDFPKKELEKRIIQRTEQMFEDGLLEENIRIREEGLADFTPFKTIGYQEFQKYFKKEATLDDVKKKIIKNTKKYAKRQRTWFRRHKHAIWTRNYSLILEESLKLIKT